MKVNLFWLKVKLGSTLLSLAPSRTDALMFVFDKAIEAASRVSESCHSLRSDNERLAADRATAVKVSQTCKLIFLNTHGNEHFNFST